MILLDTHELLWRAEHAASAPFLLQLEPMAQLPGALHGGLVLTPTRRDGLMAATALVHGFIVVTRNVADFTASGVDVFNAWDDGG